MTAVIGIGIALGLIGIGVLAMLVAGVKSLFTGQHDLKKVLTFLIPAIVFGVSYGVTGAAADAGIATMLFLIAVMALLIVLTGMRSTFNI